MTTRYFILDSFSPKEQADNKVKEEVNILAEQFPELASVEHIIGAMRHSDERAAITRLILFLETGGDINKISADTGEYILIQASKWSMHDVVFTCIANNADVTVTDKEGNTALDVATSELIIKKLTEKGAKYNKEPVKVTETELTFKATIENRIMLARDLVDACSDRFVDSGVEEFSEACAKAWFVLDWYINNYKNNFSFLQLLQLYQESYIIRQDFVYEDEEHPDTGEYEPKTEDLRSKDPKAYIVKLTEDHFKIFSKLCYDNFEVNAAYAYSNKIDADNALTKDLEFTNDLILVIPSEAMKKAKFSDYFYKKPWGGIRYYNAFI